MKGPGVDEYLWYQVRNAVPRNRPAALPFQAGQVDGNQVIIVNGDVVKLTPDKPDDDPHMDFIEGGNDLEAAWVRRDWGKNVLIVDGNIAAHDWPFILYHEAHERRLMQKGWSYPRAHKSANAAEKELRVRAMKGASNGRNTV